MSADEERQALLGLALASLPNEAEVREAVFGDKEQPPRLAEALQILDRLTLHGARASNRVLALDLLAKVAHRRRSALEEATSELYGFVQSAVIEGERRASGKAEAPAPLDAEVEASEAPEAEAPDALEAEADAPVLAEPERAALEAPQPDDPRVNATVGALRDVTLLPAEEHHWPTFARAAQEPLQLSDEEVDRPLCTDEQVVSMPNGLDAVRTAVWFWSDKPAKDFAAWTDPRTWDKSCHLFFKAVEQKAGATVPAAASEFTATFSETVFIDGESTLSTDLVFSRSVDEPHLYALEFDLPAPPLPQGAQILVDTGQVTVREDPLAPTSKRTALLAEKYILFADPAYLTWPTVACDLFWTEFAITMALGC